jgi:hypothetical protein
MDPWAFMNYDLDFEYTDDCHAPSEVSEMYPGGQWFISYVGCENCYIIFNNKKYKTVEYNNETKQLRFATEENIEEKDDELTFKKYDLYSITISPV